MAVGDDDKRGQVVQMLAEAKIEADKKSKGKSPRAEEPVDQSTTKRKGGAELVYIRLEDPAGLPDALNAITQIKRSE